MNTQSYNLLLNTVQSEIPKLNYEQQLEILSALVSAMNKKKSKTRKMPKEEALALFRELKGSLKVPKDFDPRQEFLDYLDERYLK